MQSLGLIAWGVSKLRRPGNPPTYDTLPEIRKYKQVHSYGDNFCSTRASGPNFCSNVVNHTCNTSVKYGAVSMSLARDINRQVHRPDQA